MIAPLLTPDAVAQRLGCSKRTVRRMVAKGQVPEPLRIGRLIRWTREAIDAWIAEGCPPQKGRGIPRKSP